MSKRRIKVLTLEEWAHREESAKYGSMWRLPETLLSVEHGRRLLQFGRENGIEHIHTTVEVWLAMTLADSRWGALPYDRRHEMFRLRKWFWMELMSWLAAMRGNVEGQISADIEALVRSGDYHIERLPSTMMGVSPDEVPPEEKP